MASLIPGYEYDIFISYRQKDNKGDKWVSEFVEALKTELESTFKDEISVYFDINPHDGLLETHDVGASLKEKLKCLVFIPVISRTYCDPKSFAWEHEFKAFVELASKDQFGLKIKLPNGNVASRVLPVRIHDLDNDDIKLCESVLGGVLRGIEFIYKEPGVNKSLTADDDEKINQNKTRYRNQINKVGNAIKEIISGLKTEPGKEIIQHHESSKEVKREEGKEVQEKPTRTSKRKLLSGVVILAILIIAAILAYPKIFKRATLEKLRSSGERITVAVMPFQNMTNDTSWNVWQDGIQFNLITSLSDYSDELKISQPEYINNLIQSKKLSEYTSITPSIASAISQKLDANVFIFGNINTEGIIIRVNAQLFDSKTKEVFKSFQIEGNSDKIMPIIDSLSAQIRDFLLITILEKNNIEFRKVTFTNFPLAYEYFILGRNAWYKFDYISTINWCRKAVEIDTNFTHAIRLLSLAYRQRGLYDEAKKWCLKIYTNNRIMGLEERLWIDYLYTELFETPYQSIKCLKQLQQIDDKSPVYYYNLGLRYGSLMQYDNAIPQYEKALEIISKLGLKPLGEVYYFRLGLAYHKTGQYKKEKKLYKNAEQNFPDSPSVIYRQAVLALSEGDTKDANEYIEKYNSILKQNSATEADMSTRLAMIYEEVDILDKAEEYYRKALSLEPKSQWRMNTLSYFLIEKDRNPNDGLQIVDTALKSNPDNYNFLHTKGWGLFKQRKYNEALVILQKSWDLRREKAIYDHQAYLHLEAAKKAVAGVK